MLLFVATRRAGRSSNGRTADSDSAYRGSNPCLPATRLGYASLVAGRPFQASTGSLRAPVSARIPASQPLSSDPHKASEPQQIQALRSQSTRRDEWTPTSLPIPANLVNSLSKSLNVWARTVRVALSASVSDRSSEFLRLERRVSRLDLAPWRLLGTQTRCAPVSLMRRCPLLRRRRRQDCRK